MFPGLAYLDKPNLVCNGCGKATGEIGSDIIDKLLAGGFPVEILPLCLDCRNDRGINPAEFLKLSHFCTDSCRTLDESAHRKYFELQARADWLRNLREKIVKERDRLFELEKQLDKSIDLYVKTVQAAVDMYSKKGQA